MLSTTADKSEPSFPLLRLLASILIAFLFAIPLSACGSESEISPPPNYAEKLAGSPTPLAALHKQANEVLDGGKDAFDSRIDELEGLPKVVNVWGSWCVPCREEFPHFQQASASMGRTVAFLGVDSQDDTELAENFLEMNQVAYPSYADHDEAIGRSLGLTGGIPATVFFNADGEQTFTKFGPYTSRDDLEADIKLHAIEGTSN